MVKVYTRLGQKSPCVRMVLVPCLWGGAGRSGRSQMSDVRHLGDEQFHQLRIPLRPGA